MESRARWRRGGVLVVTALVTGVAAAGCTRPGTAPSAQVATVTSPARCQVAGPGSGADPSEELDRLRAACERALPAVAQVWPDWSGTALIRVSSTDLDPGTAAHVEGFTHDGEPALDDRVVVAPGLTDELTAEGLDVVLRHELTHLAMRSTGTAPLPLWVSEGLAMHVGYASVTGPRRDRRPELERLRARVASGDWTGTVPGAALFDDPESLPEAYTAAWLGAEVLLERVGQDRVVEALRRPAAGPGPDDADSLTDEARTRQLMGSLGVSRQWLEEQWRTGLVRRTS